MLVIVIGVSGSGKTTVGKAIAEKMNFEFYDADDYHSVSNKNKMSAGIPLNDEDRWEWLHSLRELIVRKSQIGIVMACSALKRCYRDVLTNQNSQCNDTDLRRVDHVIFIHLDGEFELVHTRMRERRNHFMPESLLVSQYQTLERLQSDENGFAVSIDQPLPEIVDDVVRRLSAREDS